jgi:hypothetical protein
MSLGFKLETFRDHRRITQYNISRDNLVSIKKGGHDERTYHGANDGAGI